MKCLTCGAEIDITKDPECRVCGSLHRDKVKADTSKADKKKAEDEKKGNK